MKKILIIDDSKAVHAFVKDCLKSCNYQIRDVFNGREALDLINTGEAFDLILLDWEMPILDGPSTMDRMPKSQKAPVLMMTTKNKPEEISMMLEKGVSEYILKPFTADIIVEKIQNAMSEGMKHAA